MLQNFDRDQPSPLLLGIVIVAAAITWRVTAGSQASAESSKQALPCPFSCCDDVQCFPPGVEFKLTREEAAAAAAKQANMVSIGVPVGMPSCPGPALVEMPPLPAAVECVQPVP